MIDRTQAHEILRRCRVELGADYHTLRMTQVADLLVEADRVKYHKPKLANGTRARYFHAFLQRRARKETGK